MSSGSSSRHRLKEVFARCRSFFSGRGNASLARAIEKEPEPRVSDLTSTKITECEIHGRRVLQIRDEDGRITNCFWKLTPKQEQTIRTYSRAMVLLTQQKHEE